MNRWIVMIGVVLLVGAATLAIAARQWMFTERFPVGWRWEVNALGRNIPADEMGANTDPESIDLSTSPINLVHRTLEVVRANDDGSVHIEDHYVSTNPVGNMLIWEFTHRADVNPRTGLHSNEAYAGDSFLMPRNAQKITYNIRNTSYQGIPLAFQREETVAGILTYVYTFRGGQNTSADYPDMTFADGQTLFCFDMELNWWVEPNTGEVVKSFEACHGDWLIDTTTGERLAFLGAWMAETTGDDLIRRTDHINAQLATYRWATVFGPSLMGGAGLALLAFAFATRQRANVTSMPGGAA